ncbi:MAG: PadR family transcriptional regulator [Andreesenia angusta]|nr:PadR family transcriptional regulator [Andreesenia angusta]
MAKNERSRQFPSRLSTTSFARLYILHLLNQKSYYGNAIMDEIKMRLNGLWEPSPGMIYPMLRKLESDGYIEGWWEEPDRRSIKNYKLTDRGYEYYKRIKLLYKDDLTDSLKMLKLIKEDIYKEP